MADAAVEAGSDRFGIPADTFDMAVGRRLRALRHASGLTLKAAADRGRISIGLLSQIERGLSSPSLRVTARLAAVFGVSLTDLVATALSGDGSRVRP